MAIGQADVGWFPGLEDPTGDCTWPPAVVLMAHLSTSRSKALLHNKSVLELGAGNGSLAKFLALNSQPRKLLATDLPHRLEPLRNALHGIACADAAALCWGDVDAVKMICKEHFGTPYAEVVIISDCLYTNWVEDSVAPLALTVNAALGADADGAARFKQVNNVAFLAYLPRSKPLEAHFFECVTNLGLQSMPLRLPESYVLKSFEDARAFGEEELLAVRLCEISAGFLSARKTLGLPDLRNAGTKWGRYQLNGGVEAGAGGATLRGGLRQGAGGGRAPDAPFTGVSTNPPLLRFSPDVNHAAHAANLSRACLVASA
eukprot:s168_g53.t1